MHVIFSVVCEKFVKNCIGKKNRLNGLKRWLVGFLNAHFVLYPPTNELIEGLFGIVIEENFNVF